MPPTRSRRGGTFRVIMRATRYDQADIDHWWWHRNDMRFAVFEADKMLAYWLGIG